eukprot:Opistho-2@90025
MKRKLQIIVPLLALTSLHVCQAQPAAPAAQQQQQPQASDWVEAEVRRIDLANKKLTLKHGEIKSIDMPPMTMVFVLKDGAASAETLAGLKVGDKVRFQAAIVEGRTLVTALQR